MILTGISVFVVSLTLVTYSEEILKQGAGGFVSMAEYALLLLPPTASTFMAISVLLGILLALVELSYRSELTAIWATGPFAGANCVHAVTAGIGHVVVRHS